MTREHRKARLAAGHLSLVLLVAAAFASCTSFGAPPMVSEVPPCEVRPLVLKYTIMDTLQEIWATQVVGEAPFDEAHYAAFGADTASHFAWMKACYQSMDESQKGDLRTMFSVGYWNYMNLMTEISDDSSISEIVSWISNLSPLSEYGAIVPRARSAAARLLPWFYSGYLEAYLKEQSPIYLQRARDLNAAITATDFHVLDFMEKESGIKFSQTRKALFYFTLRPVGAVGMRFGDVVISTLQRTIENVDRVFSTPFHEFSHALFRTFTNKANFVAACEVARADLAFVNFYQSRHFAQMGYPDWASFCEENLVNGFALFLGSKRGQEITPTRQNYWLDYDFYTFLVRSGIDAARGSSLEDACETFLRSLATIPDTKG